MKNLLFIAVLFIFSTACNKDDRPDPKKNTGDSQPDTIYHYYYGSTHYHYEYNTTSGASGMKDSTYVDTVAVRIVKDSIRFEYTPYSNINAESFTYSKTDTSTMFNSQSQKYDGIHFTIKNDSLYAILATANGFYSHVYKFSGKR